MIPSSWPLPSTDTRHSIPLAIDGRVKPGNDYGRRGDGVRGGRR